jgi:translocation and assembly module TamB
VELPEGLWPDSLVVDVEVPSALEASARVLATGLSLAEDESLAVRADVAVADSSVAATFQVTAGAATVVGGEIRAPASSSLVGGRVALADGPLTGHVEIDGFRVPAPAQADGRSFAVDGRIDVGGTTSAPRGEGELTVSFPEWPLLDRHALVVRASSDSGAIAAALSGTDDRGVERMRGSARLPARLSLVPPSFERPAEEPLRAELHAAGADLRRLGPFLPDGMDLGGVLDLDFVAEGPPAELALDGRVSAKGVAITAADGSRVQGDVSITVAGTTARPAIDGEIRVVQGVIQIPETSKTLHPSDGQAKLWESDWKPPADSLVAPAAPPDTTVAIPADLDVRVIVPGQVWIRGRNMMFELEGTLAVAQRGAGPTVTGELRAVRGRMTFVGRRFTVSRGEVVFYGDDELDPSLDIALRCDLGGKTFWIEVTGTARKPKLALRSEPEEMSEGDIMSYLLFGSSMSDLDGGQEELMGRLAGAYASAELNERLSGSGVDVVSVDTGDKERGSSLTVGKYVSQKMLVSYEQALDDVAESLLSVEYLLTQRFRLSTLYGDTQSGVELRFDNDY